MLKVLVKIIRPLGNNNEFVAYFEDEEHLKKSVEYMSLYTLNERIEITPIPGPENKSISD